MMMTTNADEQKVRECAYRIWEREGRPQGREAEHWEKALRELAMEGASARRPKPRAAGKLTRSTKTSTKGDSRVKKMVAQAKEALDGPAAEGPRPPAQNGKRRAKPDSPTGKRPPRRS
ncbi:MAG TPA: DUF2934 domain-containing protein [Candidatus Binataceae bacterium]|nr:DUF2934 domain-containing protein [Candidatus Binataceae bacterium]